MLLPKREFLHHLDRVLCGGLFPEVVFTGAFEVAALSHDRTVAVIAAPLQGVEPLPQPVGALDLALLTKAIKSLGEDDKGSVSVDFDTENNRILVEERGRGKYQLVTASPSTISTQMSPETREALEKKAGESGLDVVVSKQWVEDVRKAVSLLNPQDIVASVVPKAIEWHIGEDTAHNAEVVQPGPKKGALTKEPYTLSLNPDHMASILSQIVDFTDTKLTLTGPESIIRIADAKVAYIISPRRKTS